MIRLEVGNVPSWSASILLGPLERANLNPFFSSFPFYLKTETDRVSETSCIVYLVY
jgi:hypothetical protein